MIQTFLIALAALTALAIAGYLAFTSSELEEELEEAGEEVAGEVKELDDVLDSIREDAREAVGELDDLLEQAELDESVAIELRELREFAADEFEETPPGILIEQAVVKGEKFGKKFGGSVGDLEERVREVHGELGDLTEFLRTFFETAKTVADENVTEVLTGEEQLPKEGENRFPHIGYLESQDIETYGDLLEHRDDFTAIKQIGGSRAEDIRQRLREDGFLR